MIRFQKRNFDIFATTIYQFIFDDKTLWFAFKKGTLIYLQQLKQLNYILSFRCDSLSKKELWYICNNYHHYWWSDWCVVIRFQKRNFDIFATTLLFFFQALRMLWFAFKKGTLIYLQQLDAEQIKLVAVVIRFQKRNFDIFATTHKYCDCNDV